MIDEAEVAERVGLLGAEHAADFGPAMRWLVEHGSDARLALRELAEQGGTDMATRRAFDVLGRIGHADDVAVLAARLRTARGTLAEDAAHGLALHPADGARAALLDATTASEPEIVAAAVSALGERGDVSVRPQLEKLLGHPDEAVQHRAKIALEELRR